MCVLMVLFEQVVSSVQFDLCIAFSLEAFLVGNYNIVLLLAGLLLKVISL